MKRFLFILAFLPALGFGEGPHFRHKDATLQLEFDNVYGDLRRVRSTVPTGSTNYVQVNPSSEQSGAFNISSGTVGDRFHVGKSTKPVFMVIENTREVRFDGTNTNTNSSDGTFRIRNTGAVVGNRVIRFSGGSLVDPLIYASGATDELYIGNTSGSVTSTSVVVSAAGEITQPRQPSFLATSSGATDVTGDGTSYTINYANEIYDQGGDYNNTTFTFTAPVSGRYQINATTDLVQILNTHTTRSLTVVTSNRNYFFGQSQLLAQDFLSLVATVVADMDANDTAFVQARAASSTKTVDIGGVTEAHFSITLIN